jgi:hypothetical protein
MRAVMSTEAIRNAECGVRNAPRHIGLVPSTPRSAFRISHWLFLIAACNPATTRPDFRPFPEARAERLAAARERVIPGLATLVRAESLRVKRVSGVDGYLETDWFDVGTHRSFGDGHYIPDPAHTIKLRCWADPYVPSQTILTIEAVYRPRYDPSRAERDLEAPLPPGHAAGPLVDSLLQRARATFGSPKGADAILPS